MLRTFLSPPLDFALTAGATATVLLTFIAWLKFADADLTVLFNSLFGRSIGSLKGKVVWITGASSGIGEYLAYELARAGARLVLSGTNSDSLTAVKDRCCEIRGDAEVITVPFDISDFASHQSQLKKVLTHYGKVDILVNNAGRSQRAAFGEIDIQTDKEMFDINVFGPVSLTRHVMKHFESAGVRGHVVVTSSAAGKLGAPQSATYTGSKHALHGYFECLRIEAAITGGMDVTMVVPGPVRSRIRERAFTSSPGQVYGLEDTPDAKLLSTERCAYLMAVAMANKLDEVWISQNPVLILLYVTQYMPTIFRRYLVKVIFTKQRIAKIREGR